VPGDWLWDWLGKWALKQWLEGAIQLIFPVSRSPGGCRKAGAQDGWVAWAQWVEGVGLGWQGPGFVLRMCSVGVKVRVGVRVVVYRLGFHCRYDQRSSGPQRSGANWLR